MKIRTIADLGDESRESELFVPVGTVLEVESDEGGSYIVRWQSWTIPVYKDECEIVEE